ncbi:hypothetical protein HPB50_026644 [Hyalomma asiaticum]|uniref:Uncharacterized protein n=1 Tax=Hyalomma asiaticum TaxID=266040 RepID=A0ACB7T1X8_HYAAI|nr:hypothetical protein HPB50_026644 [Hyalomma asiaticum]
MDVPTEDLPPVFTLSSTTGRSRAYDLLLREAGRILNCQPNRVLLSPRRRTRRTKRRTPVRPARRAQPANMTTSQPAVQPGALLPARPAIATSRGSRGVHLVHPFAGTDPLLSADTRKRA